LRSYVDSHHLEQVIALCDSIHWSSTFGCGLYYTSYFGTCPLLGTSLLTTYSHKHMWLLTRVYGRRLGTMLHDVRIMDAPLMIALLSCNLFVMCSNNVVSI